MLNKSLKVTALAGGVGGAKLAHGLARCLSPENLTLIVNVGDDFEHLGLHISPDLDTVCYTLAGLSNPTTGWGRVDETWSVYQELEKLGGPAWFHLGDRDLATHLERTRRLRAGQALSQIMRDFCAAWGIQPTILPATDDFTPTWVTTDEGELPFQEYFVHRQCQPRVTGFRFEGAAQASPAPGVLEALRAADLVIFCPSNPWVSIDPILAIPGIREAIYPVHHPRPPRRGTIYRAPTTRADTGGKTQVFRYSPIVVAVSPIIAGKAVKGPAAKMYAELGIEPSALAVAQHYGKLLSGFVLDRLDEDQAEAIQSLGIHPFAIHTLMPTSTERQRLAQEVLELGQSLYSGMQEAPE